jgi:hypothetical protein
MISNVDGVNSNAFVAYSTDFGVGLAPLETLWSISIRNSLHGVRLRYSIKGSECILIGPLQKRLAITKIATNS